MSRTLPILDRALLAQQLEPGTVERGLSVFHNQQVLDTLPAARGDGAWHFHGQVLGSRGESYACEVDIGCAADGRIERLEGRCTCPVAVNCQHAVAVTYKGIQRLRQVLFGSGAGRPAPAPAPVPGADPQQLREAALRCADRALRLWLDELESPRLDPGSGAPLPDSKEQPVYVLEEASATAARPGVLRLRIGLAHRLRSGAWSKVKWPAYLTGERHAPLDDELLRLVKGLSVSSYGPTALSCQLTGEAGLLALRLAGERGRLFLAAGDRTIGTPVRLGSARACAWRWAEVRTRPEEPPWLQLQPQPRAGERWFGNTPPLYVDEAGGLCGPLTVAGLAAAQVAHLFSAPPVPAEALQGQAERLLRRLAQVALPPSVAEAQRLTGVAPALRVHVGPATDGARPPEGLLVAELQIVYGTHAVPPLRQDNPLLVRKTRDGVPALLLERDLGAEQGLLARWSAFGLAEHHPGRFHLPATPDADQQWLRWLDQDFEPWRAAGFLVTVQEGLADAILRADGLDVQWTPVAEAEPGHAAPDGASSPWFDLSLGILVAGERRDILPLVPQLLARLPRAGDRAAPAPLPGHVYLPRPEGGYLRLPVAPLQPWIEALLDLVGERDARLGGVLRLSRLEALRVGAALGSDGDWAGAQALRNLLGTLAGSEPLPRVQPPAGLQATLRPYQQHGLDWLQFLRHNGLAGILADEMGLGKTLQTLAHLEVERAAGRLDLPALVVAPVSLLGNWRREAARFAPRLRTLVLHGSERHEAARKLAEHDLVIAPYSLLARDRERWLAQGWHLVVLDEAQTIKNADTHAARVASQLRARHRLCLSGTPMENHLGELWSLFHFLMPGFLGSRTRFEQVFRIPIEKRADEPRLGQLRRRVAPFILRRAKEAVAAELPPKQEVVVPVDLEPAQADLYETIRLTTEKTVREALAAQGLARSRIQVLDALLKLRQVCCDPRLVPSAAARRVRQSAKLELLLSMLPELLQEGRRVLLFSQFSSMLALIEQELARHGIAWTKLTGRSRDRDALVARFTDGEVPLFLLTLKAGGVGLNLPQADTVIHYDPWWNPAAERQATDRAHRIGQERKVLVYKLVAQGTVEERMLALQERKAALAEGVLGAAAARRQPMFSEQDLQELLRPLSSLDDAPAAAATAAVAVPRRRRAAV